MTDLIALGESAGITWTDYQRKALVAAAIQPGPSQRRCLYYKTGAGKTFTALGQMRAWGQQHVVVIAPPSTHQAWHSSAGRMAMVVECMSHAKFRMKNTKLSRTLPVIVDEYHMLGGHNGQGFKRVQTLARHLQAPMVICSATPNYNDAERVYCIQSVLDPVSVKGGYLQFLYANCTTEADMFSMTPKVTGFHRFKNAEEYLAALPNVDYLPDDLVYTIEDVPYVEPPTPEMDTYGYDRRNHKMIASIMEERHTRRYQGLVEDEYLFENIEEMLWKLAPVYAMPTLIYCNHATIAEAALYSFDNRQSGTTYSLITGATSKKKKDQILESFRRGKIQFLIGTASLATGTDGLDKVCDTLIILDDTDDDSLRRQLIGRIMPRGKDTDASNKRVYRLVPQ